LRSDLVYSQNWLDVFGDDGQSGYITKLKKENKKKTLQTPKELNQEL
jgi:hypothetical protein